MTEDDQFDFIDPPFDDDPLPSYSSPSPRMIESPPAFLPSWNFSKAVDWMINRQLPIPGRIVPSPGTLCGTAKALDLMTPTSPLVQQLAPPFGSCSDFCHFSLLIHQIKAFLLSAPTANAGGFTEAKKKGWSYVCTSSFCGYCRSTGKDIPGHLLQLLVGFVHTILTTCIPFEDSFVIEQIAKFSTQCSLGPFGPYTLVVPPELKQQLADFIRKMSQPASNYQLWPDSICRPQPRTLLAILPHSV